MIYKDYGKLSTVTENSFGDSVKERTDTNLNGMCRKRTGDRLRTLHLFKYTDQPFLLPHIMIWVMLFSTRAKVGFNSYPHGISLRGL